MELGGGFKRFSFVHCTWVNDPIWRAYFFAKGLVKPPTRSHFYPTVTWNVTSWCRNKNSHRSKMLTPKKLSVSTTSSPGGFTLSYFTPKLVNVFPLGWFRSQPFQRSYAEWSVTLSPSFLRKVIQNLRVFAGQSRFKRKALTAREALGKRWCSNGFFLHGKRDDSNIKWLGTWQNFRCFL